MSPAPRPRIRNSCSNHADNVQATGFVEHIKLPHYVDFQSELELIRKIRAEAITAQAGAEAAE